MRKASHTRQEIASLFGMETSQIKSGITRYNREQARLSAGLPPKCRGWPSKDTPPANTGEYQHEINRLKMGSQLLWDFLQFVGRK